jgi:hypothetical protein
MSVKQVRSRIFFHGLLLVREFEQVEISIGHHDVVGLAADPAAHINVTVGPAGALAIDMETDAGFALTTGSATAASDIERNRDEIADLEVLDIAALLDHFAGDFVGPAPISLLTPWLSHKCWLK